MSRYSGAFSIMAKIYVRIPYVLVITCLRGMLLVYGHETRGRVAPEGGVSINRNIPIRHVLIDL